VPSWVLPPPPDDACDFHLAVDRPPFPLAAPSLVASPPAVAPEETRPAPAEPTAASQVEPGPPPSAASGDPERGAADADQTGALLAALLDGVASAAAARRRALDASEHDLVELAITIAQRVLAREISTDPAIVAAWARQGLDALAEKDEAVIAIAPELETLMPCAAWASAVGDAAEVIVDRSLPRFGCEVRGRFGRVDVGVEARVDTIVDALGAACASDEGGERA
jgi:hypothetical protein